MICVDPIRADPEYTFNRYMPAEYDDRFKLILSVGVFSFSNNFPVLSKSEMEIFVAFIFLVFMYTKLLLGLGYTSHKYELPTAFFCFKLINSNGS
jgi:hypothetical protein